MGDVVNLRLARKRAARVRREEDAEARRRLYGEPAALRQARKAADAAASRKLDQHRLDAPSPADQGDQGGGATR